MSLSPRVMQPHPDVSVHSRPAVSVHPRLMHPHPVVFMHPRLIHARPTTGTRVTMLTGPVRTQERGRRGWRRRDPRPALTWLRAVRLHGSPPRPAEGRWRPPPLPAARPACGATPPASIPTHRWLFPRQPLATRLFIGQMRSTPSPAAIFVWGKEHATAGVAAGGQCPRPDAIFVKGSNGHGRSRAFIFV